MAWRPSPPIVIEAGRSQHPPAVAPPAATERHARRRHASSRRQSACAGWPADPPGYPRAPGVPGAPARPLAGPRPGRCARAGALRRRPRLRFRVRRRHRPVAWRASLGVVPTHVGRGCLLLPAAALPDLEGHARAARPLRLVLVPPAAAGASRPERLARLPARPSAALRTRERPAGGPAICDISVALPGRPLGRGALPPVGDRTHAGGAARLPPLPPARLARLAPGLAWLRDPRPLHAR